MKKVMLALGALLAMLLGGLLALRLYVVDTLQGSYDAAARLHAVRAAQALPAFVADQDRLAALPFFSRAQYAPDASAVLNDRLRWPGQEASDQHLGLPADLEGRLAAWGKDWPKHAAEVDYAALDLDWLSELTEYGRWTLLTERTLETLQTRPGATLALPDFGVLIRMAKLRMMKGLAVGEPKAAGREVEQLANLFYRSETRVGGLVALALLKQESRLREVWAAQGHDVAGWVTLTDPQLDAFRDVLGSGSAFASPLTPSDVAEAALTAAAPRVGGCTALTEQAAVLAQVRVSHDPSLESGLKRFQGWLDHPPRGCDLRLARALWDAKRAPLTPAQLKAQLAGNSEDDTARALLPTFARGYEGKLILALQHTDASFEKLLAGPDGGQP
jgi:hypothetical protein